MIRALAAWVLVTLLAAGCASVPAGVKLHEGDRERCAAAPAEEPCTVWSVPELRAFGRYFFERGRQAERSSL